MAKSVSRRLGLSATSLVALLLAVTPAQAQDDGRTAATAALKEAQDARAQAMVALEKADRAIANAVAILGTGQDDASVSRSQAPLHQAGVGNMEPLKPANTVRWQVALDEIATPQTTKSIANEPIDRIAQRADPVFGFAAGKEGDYGKLGVRLNWRDAQDGTRDRSFSQSLELASRVRIDKNRGAELRRFTPDGNSWASDLAMRADYRLGWYKDIYKSKASDDPQAKMAAARSKADAALRTLCATEDLLNLDKCRTSEGLENWLSSLEQDSASFKKAALILRARAFGLDEKGAPLPPRYLVGVQGEYGWLTENFFPAGTLPVTPDDQAPSKERYNPLSVKLYAGTSLLPGPDNAGFNLTAVGSVGWQRSYDYARGTEGQQVCLPSPSRGYTACGTFNLAAPFKAEGLTTGVGLNLLTRKFSLLGKLRGSAFWARDFALDRSTYTGELAFAVNDDGTSFTGVRYTHITAGLDPLGNLLKRDGSLSIFFSTDFVYPTIP